MFICIDNNKVINSDHITHYETCEGNMLMIHFTSGKSLTILYVLDKDFNYDVSRLDELLGAEHE